MRYIIYNKAKDRIVNILERYPESISSEHIVLEIDEDKFVHSKCIKIERNDEDYTIRYLSYFECLNRLKHEKIEQLKQIAFNYINEKYPLWKQNNDILDKEKNVVEIVSLSNGKLASDELRKLIYDILAKHKKEYEVYAYIAKKLGIAKLDSNGNILVSVLVVNGKRKTIKINEVSSIKEQVLDVQVIVEDEFKEKFTMLTDLFKQLINIARRIYWKDLIRQKVNLIEQKILGVTKIEELENIDLFSFFNEV